MAANEMDANAQQRAEVAALFVGANVDGAPEVVTSPSGRFRLTIQSYRTKPDAWNYTRGTVVRIADGVTVCDIQRNYGNFHHSFVEKDGREYLITGRSYMSQTIVDLDRGEEYEPPGSHYESGAFCWTRCYLSPDGNTLVVDGCHWACPYEYRFFDFSDPARGWPPLSIVGAEWVGEPSDLRRPQWLDATTVDCFQCDADGEPQERSRLARRGDEMVVVEHWVADAERARRDRSARAEAEQDAWWESFTTSEPMYLRLLALVRSNDLPCDNLGWQPGGRRIVLWFRRVQPRTSADLEWDTAKLTLGVQLYGADGSRGEMLAFACSLAGLEDAVAAIAAAFR